MIIRGTNGNDILEAVAGDNIVIGAGGDDIIYAYSGRNRIYDGTGSDTVHFDGNGKGVIYADATDASGNDIYNIGPSVHAELSYASAASALNIDLRNGIATGLEIGTDHIGRYSINVTGGSGDDAMHAQGYLSTALGGGSGDDKIYGHDGIDKLTGGAGDDVIAGGHGSDWLSGGDGNDVLDSYGYIGQLVEAGPFRNQEDKSNKLAGGAGSDHISSYGYGDQVHDGVGSDTVLLTKSNSALRAHVADLSKPESRSSQDMDDTYRYSEYYDALIKKTYYDDAAERTYKSKETALLSYEDSSAGLAINLGQGYAQGADIGFDSITGFTKAAGGAGDDHFTGGYVSLTTDETKADINRFFGNGGNDTFRCYADKTIAYGGAGDDVFIGSYFKEYFHGGEGDNLMRGGGGADVFYAFTAPANRAERSEVTDFQNGVDKIGVSRAAAADFAALQRMASEDVNGDLVLNNPGIGSTGQTMTVNGLTLETFDRGDVYFF